MTIHKSLQTQTMSLMGIGFMSIFCGVSGCGDSSQAADQTLNVAVQGEAMAGAVVSVPAGIDCGATCTSTFPIDTSVALAAMTADPYEFAGWGGDCTGSSPTCQILMDGDKNVTAAFRKIPVNLQLTLNGPGGGMVTSMPAGLQCTNSCSASFDKNATLTLTAAPDNTSVFASWGGACTGSTPSCTLTLSADTQVTASFVKPASCEQIRAAAPTSADGNYTLFIGGDGTKPWTAYCKMSVTPARSYLNLTNIGANQNFSQYTAGGQAPGTSVRTSYSKVRIDPMALMIDTTDQTFSTSTGSLMSGTSAVTSMPYATATDCLTPSSATGVANIDLTGTQFAIAQGALAIGGFRPGGTTTPTPDGQIRAVSMTGGGFCGWNAPRGASSPINKNGSPLSLVYFP